MEFLGLVAADLGLAAADLGLGGARVEAADLSLDRARLVAADVAPGVPPAATPSSVRATFSRVMVQFSRPPVTGCS